jgi:hypothetical protein
MRVMTNFPSFPNDINPFEIVHKDDRMGNSGVEA